MLIASPQPLVSVDPADDFRVVASQDLPMPLSPTNSPLASAGEESDDDDFEEFDEDDFDDEFDDDFEEEFEDEYEADADDGFADLPDDFTGEVGEDTDD